MYPLVTILLAAAVLRERLNAVQLLGIPLAAGAFFLLNIEGTTAPGQAWWTSLAQPWMAYALVALVLWGVLAIFQKVSTAHVSTQLSTVCFAAAFVPVAVALAALRLVRWDLPAKAWALGVLFGVLLGVGTLVVFAAYRTGKASVVTAVYALYPAVTVCIAVPLFDEPIGWRKVVAVVLAIAAAMALSYERQEAGAPAARGFEVVPTATED
jgi:drug/metabolite transporter (DMT)-like permease